MMVAELDRVLESLHELEAATSRLAEDIRALGQELGEPTSPGERTELEDVTGEDGAERKPDPGRRLHGHRLADWTDRVQGLAAGLADACADQVELLALELARPAGQPSASGPHELLEGSREELMATATALAFSAGRAARVVTSAGEARVELGLILTELEPAVPLEAADAAHRARRALERAVLVAGQGTDASNEDGARREPAVADGAASTDGMSSVS